MGKLKQLTKEEAEDRLSWLLHHAGPNLWRSVDWPQEAGPRLDAKAIEALHEMKRVSAEVANYYLNLEPQVEWEVGVEEVHRFKNDPDGPHCAECMAPYAEHKEG